MSTPKFGETHNLVAFLDKPEESEGFEQIINFLNASSIRYALTIQALVDGKKVIVTETSVRQSLHLKDAKGTNCLTTATIFAELETIGAKTTAWNEFSSTVASTIIFEDMSEHKEIYVTPSHTKKIFANMKREGKGFSGRITPLFQTKMVQAPEEVEPITDEATYEEHVYTPSYDPSQSSEDRMQLNELMDLCAKLSDRVLVLENTNTSQAAEIATLNERVKKLEKKWRSITYKPKRLYMVGLSRRIESFEDASLCAQEDASKQGRKIADFNADTESIVNTATKSSILVSDVDLVTTAGEVVTTASIEILEELTLAQTLIEIKSAKPKAVTTAATTAKNKGKAKMVEPEKPLKKKDQIAIDKEVARNLEAQLQAELEEEERLSRQKEEEANIALIESWDNTQAMMDADFQLA
ncbi:hypothetical protein Tco_0365700 [Tanacetum coccineum]